MASPSMTFGGSANALAGTALAAAGTVTFNIAASTVFEVQAVINNTPGTAVSATRGLRARAFTGYGTGGTAAYSTIAAAEITLPSTAASTLESQCLFLSTGSWQVQLVNLDATNGVTVSATTATVDGVA